MMARWDLEPLFAELPRLHVRFLLLAGELDRAVPMSQQRAIVARTPGARLEIIPQTGHLLHEEQPEVVARFILDEVDAAARANQDQPEK
jgi:magnesium chelatase accessory protein